MLFVYGATCHETKPYHMGFSGTGTGAQAALAANDWTCPQCGKRVREILGDICPYCGYEQHVHDWEPVTCVTIGMVHYT